MNQRLASAAGTSTLGTQRQRRGRSVVLACGWLALAGMLLTVMLGPLSISLNDLWLALSQRLGLTAADTLAPVRQGVIEQIRMPRALLGAAVGASLGIAGAAMQGFFRNPLADPGLIGVSAGGALAAVTLIVLGGTLARPLFELLGAFAMPLAAFCGALGTVALIYRISSVDNRVIVPTMLLAGVAANALAVAGIGYLQFLADDAQLRDLTLWTLGSLGGATWSRVLPAVALMIIAIAGLLKLARPMNALLLGEADAETLGVDVEQLKRRAAILTALGVGAATAVCGIISFVGLVVPHLVRILTGPDHRYVLPGSACLGAALVLFADLIARLAVAPAELPLGVVTAALGGPFFAWLLLRDKYRGGGW